MTLSKGAQVAIIAVASFGWIPFAAIAIHVWRRRRQGTARGRPLPYFSLPNIIQQQGFEPAMRPQSNANSLHLPTSAHKQNSLRHKPLPPFLVYPSQAKMDSILNHAHLADGTPLEIEQMMAKILGGMGQAEGQLDVLAGEV